MRVGIQLGEDDPVVLFGGLLIDGPESLTWSTPFGPEVHQDNVVVGDGLLEVIGRDLNRCHAYAPRDEWTADRAFAAATVSTARDSHLFHTWLRASEIARRRAEEERAEEF